MRHKAILFLWLSACWALAQEVVVLEFQADAKMRLGSQIESALWDYTTVKPMSRQAYMAEAARAGVANAQTPAGFARTVAHLKEVVVAVGGRVEGNNVEIFIWDRAGASLWNRRLPLKQGVLAQQLAQRLANAIATAVEVQTHREEVAEAPPPKAPEEQAPPAESAVVPAEAGGPPEAAVASIQEVAAAEAVPQQVVPQTPFLRMALLGTASWRSLCVRPGKNACIAFDKLPADAPPGNREFSSGAYAGASLQVEHFPLALLTSSVWQGLGLRLEAGYGKARKAFEDIGPSKQSARLQIQEFNWSAEALFRHFFLKPSAEDMGVHASLSLGYAGKNFLSKNLSGNSLFLPDVHRRFMKVGADTELSWPFIRVGLYANVLLQPKPGSVLTKSYGKLSSMGWSAGGALSGKVYGPLGYKVDVSWNFFRDKLLGEGWPEGGLIQETYLALKAGLLVEF